MRQHLPAFLILLILWLAMTVTVAAITDTGFGPSAAVAFVLTLFAGIPVVYVLGLAVNLSRSCCARLRAMNGPTQSTPPR